MSKKGKDDEENSGVNVAPLPLPQPLDEAPRQGNLEMPEGEEKDPLEDTLRCIECGNEIIRDSREHDQCILINDGEDLVCGDCIIKFDYASCKGCDNSFRKEKLPFLDGQCAGCAVEE